MQYIALFFTHSGAIKYGNLLNKNLIKNQTMPSPRKISSNCGVSVKFEYEGNIQDIITTDIEKLFIVEDINSYKMVYEAS